MTFFFILSPFPRSFPSSALFSSKAIPLLDREDMFLSFFNNFFFFEEITFLPAGSGSSHGQ